jgi:hypothetical protein
VCRRSAGRTEHSAADNRSLASLIVRLLRDYLAKKSAAVTVVD